MSLSEYFKPGTVRLTVTDYSETDRDKESESNIRDREKHRIRNSENRQT